MVNGVAFDQANPGSSALVSVGDEALLWDVRMEKPALVLSKSLHSFKEQPDRWCRSLCQTRIFILRPRAMASMEYGSLSLEDRSYKWISACSMISCISPSTSRGRQGSPVPVRPVPCQFRVGLRPSLQCSDGEGDGNIEERTGAGLIRLLLLRGGPPPVVVPPTSRLHLAVDGGGGGGEEGRAHPPRHQGGQYVVR